MPKESFQFGGEISLFPQRFQKRQSPFFPWLRRFFLIFSLVSLSGLLVGNILWKLKKEKPSLSLRSGSSLQLAPLLVSLKDEGRVRMARVHVRLQVDRSSLKKEILSNDKAMRQSLLILLSGRGSGEMRQKRAYFEDRFLSWMNAFLPRGSVSKVTIQTTMLN